MCTIPRPMPLSAATSPMPTWSSTSKSACGKSNSSSSWLAASHLGQPRSANVAASALFARPAVVSPGPAAARRAERRLPAAPAVTLAPSNMPGSKLTSTAAEVGHHHRCRTLVKRARLEAYPDRWMPRLHAVESIRLGAFPTEGCSLLAQPCCESPRAQGRSRCVASNCPTHTLPRNLAYVALP